MPLITEKTVLSDVEHILGSGTGILDFAIEGEDSYYTWRGTEDADWTIEDVDRVENSDEDRFIIYPAGESFTCEIAVTDSEHNTGPVRCYCDSD